MTHGSLFSGVGGFDLAAQWMGWENVLHCEINPFGRQVLKHYWPNAISYEDITKTDFTIHRGRIDILTGGFPCQPFNLAGKRKGTEDERHLWPEMLRAIREIQPRWIVGENVFGLVNWDGGLVFEQVQADLEAEGYEVQPYILPAAGVNAPHRRDRVCFVAKNTDSNGRRCKFGQEEPKARGFGYACSGNNERIQTNDGETRTSPNSDHNGSHGTENGQGYPSGNDGSQAGKDDAFQPEGCGDQATGETSSHSNQTGLQATRAEQQATGAEQHRELGGETSAYTGQSRLQDGQLDGSEIPGSGGERFNAPDDYSKAQVKSSDVADTDGERLWGQSDGIREPGQPSQEIGGDYWSNFPTQSGVRRGDDGLSSILDADAVYKGASQSPGKQQRVYSRWRNESIKAYGNAIVPQVVYQIFKAIQEYETPNMSSK